MIVPLGISKLNTRANNERSASGGSGANPKTGGERRGSLTCSQVQLLLLRDQRRSQVTSLILIISAIFLQFEPPGATWMMSSTPWFERLERETRRESSKKTKHRVGKKFGTIFSKRSSAEGARFKETSFVQFFLNSDRSFVTFNWYGSFTKKWLYQRFNWKLYQKTMKLSELQNKEDAFIIRPLKHIPYLFSNFQIYLIQSFTHVGFKVLLRQTSFY